MPDIQFGAIVPFERAPAGHLIGHVGDQPAPGHIKRLSRKQLKKALRAKVKELCEDPKFAKKIACRIVATVLEHSKLFPFR